MLQNTIVKIKDSLRFVRINSLLFMISYLRISILTTNGD